MHRELRKADIDRVYRDMRGADMPKRGAARDVGAVGEALHRNFRAAAHRLERGGGDSVGRIALVRVMLYDDALVHLRPVVAVGVLGMVRVHGVGVVGGHHEAVGQQRAVLHVAAAERGAHAAQHILKEAGIRALLRPAADLFVVEHAEHCGALAVGGVEQAAQAAVNALEVVKPCGGDELVLRAPDAAAFARVEDQVAREQRVLGDTEALRDDGLEAGFQLRGADERQHIDVRVVALAVVGASVHMYCDVRYDREVAVDVHESGHHSPALGDYRAPRDGEGAVEPC